MFYPHSGDVKIAVNTANELEQDTHIIHNASLTPCIRQEHLHICYFLLKCYI